MTMAWAEAADRATADPSCVPELYAFLEQDEALLGDRMDPPWKSARPLAKWMCL